MQGKVKWFNSERGYGFITGEDGTDYFAHYKEIVGEGRRDLEEGQLVQFEAGCNAKGPQALKIVRLGIGG